MSAQLFLIVSPDSDPRDLATRLGAVLARNPDALLIRRGGLGEAAYKSLVKLLAPPAQKAGCAVLVEGEPGLVRLLGVDGLHVSEGLTSVQQAIAALKPDFIVGASADGTRHDAMSKGELGVDYILFGPLSGSITPLDREMARWWAQTMEIPSVLSDPEADPAAADDEGCEFIGLSLAALERA